MNRRVHGELGPLAAALAAIVMLVTVLLLGRPSIEETRPDTRPLGAVLGAADRSELAAPAIGRGSGDPVVDPGVRPTDPDAVARAYLVAAHGAVGEDAGRTHRRAAGYAAPGSVPAQVGVVVIDAPPPGAVRTATVTSLELVAADRRGSRRGYRATVATATGPPGAPDTALERGEIAGYLVLARQPDGRWLVRTETPTTPPAPDLPVGEG
ncbi:hypothetical protein ACVGVM_02715 [Pseudonocardia bannensis]|uniref:Uncharacterized protein n=1 Tax=Pseudonocardia bannensis TaxID=630973 RepID=A0A848DLC5_9PSEU|nr:hypothetical protein [Pseudonocardia bannensis]NMH93306.1 hypothetical protein [Pseudonocardia bannensis]